MGALYTLIVVSALGVYILLAIGFICLVEKLGRGKKVFTYFAIVVCVLMPIWDVVLGLIIYTAACHIVPKVAIYKSAETDGIYYEGVHNYIKERDGVRIDTPTSERFKVGTNSDLPGRGFLYGESKVTEEWDGYRRHTPILPVLYRCTFLPKYETRPYLIQTECIKIDRPESRYMVRVTKRKILKVEINKKEVFDISDGTLMGEHHQVAFTYNIFPFFNWLYEYGNGGIRIFRPKAPTFFYFFEFEVLKPLPPY